MAPQSWANKEQWDWLFSRIPACQEASKGHDYSQFLEGTYHNWHINWPEENVLFPDGVPTDMAPEQKEMLTAARTEREAVRLCIHLRVATNNGLDRK